MKNKILSMNVSTMVIAIVFTVFLTNSNAQVVPSYVSTNGLLGWYPFNGNANDESNLGTNGTVNSAVLSNDRFGSVNSSFYFNGINSNIDLGINPSINSISNSFSISYWIKPQSFGGMLIANYSSQGSPASSVWRFSSKLLSNGTVEFKYVYSSSGSWQSMNSNTVTLNLNSWYHCVYTRSGSSSNIYINGNLVASNNTLASGNLDNPTSPAATTKFGYNFPSSGGIDYFNGELDDVGIWNRSLNQSEINALYNNCSLNFTSQPQNQSITTSIGSTNFSVSSSSPNATYQWQSNIGFGFLNINNAGQFSGAQSATLTLSNITTSNNNQLFRCLIQDGSCIDTSDIATLTVIDDAGITNQILTDIIVYPNPVNDMIFINNVSGESLTFEIYSVEGKKVLEGKTSNNIDVSKLSKGTYHLRIRQQNITFINQ